MNISVNRVYFLDETMLFKYISLHFDKILKKLKEWRMKYFSRQNKFQVGVPCKIIMNCNCRLLIFITKFRDEFCHSLNGSYMVS